MKLRFEKEESDVQTIDPALVTALVALCVGAAHGPRRRRQAPAHLAEAAEP
jgi:hypothetical protein